jgi:predicted ATPase
MPLRDAVLLSWELRSYRAALEQNGPVFFDRGVPDTLDYLRLTGLPVPDHIRNAAQRFRYASHVFIAPPWREIFWQDCERRSRTHLSRAGQNLHRIGL